MHQPFFTIIVPTRNRADLLPDALRSILLQDFQDFEIVVSDNFNDHKTQEVLQPYLADRKVRVIRTPQLLPMTVHWQFAAEHAVGKFVLFVTDRSVLKKGALSHIHKAIQNSNESIDLCSWTWTLYSDRYGYEYGEALLADKICPSILMDSVDVAKGFTTEPGKFAYILPRGLNSCFSLEMFKRFIAAHGSPFLPVSPDYFSAFLFLGFTSKMLHIPQPLFVSQGLSVSNGGNGYLGTSEKYLSTLGDIDWTRYVPIKAPFVDNTIFADFVAAKQKIGGSLKAVSLDLPCYYFACYQELIAKRGARVLSLERLKEFSDDWERALAKEPLDVQHATREMIKSQPFAVQIAYLRYSRFGGVFRQLKHWFTRCKAGTVKQSKLTVLEVAGHSTADLNWTKVNE